VERVSRFCPSLHLYPFLLSAMPIYGADVVIFEVEVRSLPLPPSFVKDVVLMLVLGDEVKVRVRGDPLSCFVLC